MSDFPDELTRGRCQIRPFELNNEARNKKRVLESERRKGMARRGIEEILEGRRLAKELKSF